MQEITHPNTLLFCSVGECSAYIPTSIVEGRVRCKQSITPTPSFTVVLGRALLVFYPLRYEEGFDVSQLKLHTILYPPCMNGLVTST